MNARDLHRGVEGDFWHHFSSAADNLGHPEHTSEPPVRESHLRLTHPQAYTFWIILALATEVFLPCQGSNLFCCLFWSRRAACGILVPRPGIEPKPPALEVWSLNHWTAREVQGGILMGGLCFKLHQPLLNSSSLTVLLFVKFFIHNPTPTKPSVGLVGLLNICAHKERSYLM